MASGIPEPITYVLLADGTSDRALLPVIAWTLRSLWRDSAFAAPIFIPRQHAQLSEKILEIINDYQPDLLFVHRDAENASVAERKREIPSSGTTVPIIPVRMTEAWLLVNESALRRAAGNPNGTDSLSMPPLYQLERLKDPKAMLHDLLRTASGYQKRRLRRFNAPKAVHRLANLIDDYSPLFQLGAFVDFHNHLARVLKQIRSAS